MALYGQGNLGELLKSALLKLKQTEHYDEYLKYLNEEWYYTVEDLRLAREDEKIWFALRLPGRLKLEISALLDVTFPSGYPAESKEDLPEQEEHAIPVEDDAAQHNWVKC